MFRWLILLLLLTGSVCAADAPPAPVPTDFMQYPAGPVTVLVIVGLLLSVVMVPFCLLFWGLFIFLIVKIMGRFGVTPAALLAKLVQRQMMGKGRGIVWQLAILICIPAGVMGLWLSIWFFGRPYQAGSLIVMGSACGVILGVLFVWFAKILIRQLKERMMGGMQAKMMAEMMRMRGLQ